MRTSILSPIVLALAVSTASADTMTEFLSRIGPAATESVEPGDRITRANAGKVRSLVLPGVLRLVEQGMEMRIVEHTPLEDPPAYRHATEKFHAQVRLTPDGVLEESTYVAGRPFPIIDPNDRQGVVRIALPYDPAIRPGGFASAEISRGALVAPRLPESAILSDEKGSYVYVVDGQNRVQRRAVRTGIVTDEGIAVIAGLQGSERVITRAGGFVNEGDKVNPIAARGDRTPNP